MYVRVAVQLFLCSSLAFASNDVNQNLDRHNEGTEESEEEGIPEGKSGSDDVEILRASHHDGAGALPAIADIDQFRAAIQSAFRSDTAFTGKKKHKPPTLRQLQDAPLSCSDVEEGWTKCCQDIEGIGFCTSYSSDGMTCKLEIEGFECDTCILCSGDDEGLGFNCNNIVEDFQDNDECEPTTTGVDTPSACEDTADGFKCCYPLFYVDTDAETRFRGCSTYSCPGGGSVLTDACTCEVAFEWQPCNSCEVCYVEDEDGNGFFADAKYDCSNTRGSTYNGFWFGTSEDDCYKDPTPKPTRAPTFPTPQPTRNPTSDFSTKNAPSSAYGVKPTFLVVLIVPFLLASMIC